MLYVTTLDGPAYHGFKLNPNYAFALATETYIFSQVDNSVFVAGEVFPHKLASAELLSEIKPLGIY